MSFDALLTQTVTLHIRSEDSEDDHGNPTYTESDTDVPGFASRQSASESNLGAVLAEQLRLFLKSDAPVTGWEAVTISGNRYEVIGHPWHVFNAREGVVHHVEADIRRGNT